MKDIKTYIINEMSSDMPYTEEELRDLFIKFNHKYFNDSLSLIPIKYNNRKSPIGFFRMHLENNHYIPIHIQITSKYNLSKQDIENVLVHEMIHYWVLKHFERESLIDNGHGVMFRKMMDIINKKGEHKISIKYEDQLSVFNKESYFIFLFKTKKGGYSFVKTKMNKADIIYMGTEILEKGKDFISDLKYIITDDSFFSHPTTKRKFNGYYNFDSKEKYEMFAKDATHINSEEDLVKITL